MRHYGSPPAYHPPKRLTCRRVVLRAAQAALCPPSPRGTPAIDNARRRGRPPRRAGWDDIPGRRLSPQQMDSNRALEAAKSLARSERDKER